MKLTYVDDENCSTNLACSILKEFGVPAAHAGLPLLDQALQERHYQNIVVMLIDGMGQCIFEKNLKKDGFFGNHQRGNYQSVFPPTTVAVLNSINSGLFPYEHGWLGWSCYMKDVDQNVDLFLNRVSETGELAAEYNVPWKYLGYETVLDKIRKTGVLVDVSHKCMKPYPETFEKLCERVEELCRPDGRKYIYCYWNEPDYTMHHTGCYSEESVKVLQEIENQVEKLCSHLKDTLVIVTADHGQRNTTNVSITEYPKIMECLVRNPSIEPRALNFFIKPGWEKQFQQEFDKEFGGKFVLYSKDEVRAKKLFGPGSEHPEFDAMLGEYLAVAVSDLSIFSDVGSAEEFIGVHAGMTEDEMIVPLIVIPCV